MPLKGICEDMCSPAERDYRQHNGLVHQMEAIDPWANLVTQKGRRRKFVANPNFMIKEYSRSAADKVIKASDVRPFHVLKITTEYLLEKVVKQVDVDSRAKWPIIYMFVIDRFRAIRQDITVQDLPPGETVELLERIIPFYLYSRQRCEKDVQISNHHYYDSKLHSNEVEECFSKWKDSVDHFALGSEKMKTIYLLHYCGRVDILIQFLEWKPQLSDKIMADKIFLILMAYRLNNFVAFFRIFKQSDEDIRYALWPYVERVRSNALSVISVAYNSPNVKLPEEVLRRWLAFPRQEDLYDSLAANFEHMNLTDKEFVKFSHCNSKCQTK